MKRSYYYSSIEANIFNNIMQIHTYYILFYSGVVLLYILPLSPKVYSFHLQEKLVQELWKSHWYPEVLAQKNMMLRVEINSSKALGPFLKF